MLHLAAPSDPAWLPLALDHLDEVLLDHAHAEKKAAGSAVTLIFQYPERTALLEPLSRLAREELVHFEAVLRRLAERGLRFGRRRATPYAGRLHEVVRADEPARLLDRLLCAAVIEARSCERFGLLADALAAREPALAAFYRGLLEAEARHHGVYLRLAEAVAPTEDVEHRLAAVTAHEAAVLASAPPAPGLHT